MSDPIDWLAYLEADPQYEPYLSIARAWRIDRANLLLADDAVAARDQIIKDLGFQLGTAEQGLANYAQEMEGAKHDIERLVQSVSGEANDVERLRAALREVYEVWAGSDGMVPETAPEAYQERLIRQMRDAAARGLGITGIDTGASIVMRKLTG